MTHKEAAHGDVACWLPVLWLLVICFQVRQSVPYTMRSVVLISLSVAMNLQVDEQLKSVTHGQCKARHTVSFPAAGITAL